MQVIPKTTNPGSMIFLNTEFGKSIGSDRIKNSKSGRHECILLKRTDSLPCLMGTFACVLGEGRAPFTQLGEDCFQDDNPKECIPLPN